MNHWAAFEASSACHRTLSDSGIELDVVRDFQTIPALLSEIGKEYITPFLDPHLNSFTSGGCFWLAARKEGRLVMLGGARVDDLGAEAPQFIANTFNRGYRDGCCLSVCGEVARQISGRVAYFGDLMSIGSHSLGRRNVRCFTGIANYLAVSHYGADCVFSFMRSKDVRRGSADVNGFTGRILSPIQWAERPSPDWMDEQIVYRGRDDHAPYFEALRRELVYRQVARMDDHFAPQPADQV